MGLGGSNPKKGISEVRSGSENQIMHIDKADELPVHNRKGVGNQKEKGGV